ncbi:MAG TPA: phosphoribosylamine--glycine ligase [Actinomycetota bacterium]|nr:phosphoribosylamine--glycine ligase [Actinomycetota bacterium]
MRVLVVGGGGREHALCWALARSPRVEELHAAPGNAGIASIATCHAAAAADVAAQVRLADDLDADLVVVGPEVPLVAGLADELRTRGRRAFGPGRDAARLEGSKAFAKGLMIRHGIPTARAATFSRADRARDRPEVAAFVDDLGGRAVVKADGLAAGKGVTIAADADEAAAAIGACLEGGAFGEAGSTVVVEELLDGPEVSAFALVDADTWTPLALAQDFKRLGDGGAGPNTGGMGAYSPLPWLDEAAAARIWDVVHATVRALRRERIAYSGLLYTGLMLTGDGPKVLEYNCRFGDPETEVVIPRLRSDLAEALDACARGRLADVKVDLSDEAAVTVVLASEGYPGAHGTGREIGGLAEAAAVPDSVVFHAGTAERDGRVVTAGGRVLAATGWGETVADARARAYQAAERISFDGLVRRNDIATGAVEGRGT